VLAIGNGVKSVLSQFVLIDKCGCLPEKNYKLSWYTSYVLLYTLEYICLAAFCYTELASLLYLEAVSS